MKADGSGEVEVVVNMSKSKGKLKQYMKMDKVENFRMPSEAEFEALLLRAKNTLREVEKAKATGPILFFPSQQDSKT